MSAMIEVKNLSFAYRPAEPVFDDLSFTIDRGSFTAIVGPNGAGKSTLLNLLGGSLKAKVGSIKIGSKRIESYNSKELAKQAAFVRQEFVPVFGFSVAETVMMARTQYFAAMGFESKSDREIVAQALDMTDTSRFAWRSLGQLSGGERQRVFIARALAQDTPVLLLDEPTSFLDLKHQVGIYDLLKKMQLDKGKTIVTVTHDINLASQYSDEVLLLGSDSRSYIKGETCSVFSAEQIAESFGVRVFQGQIGNGRFFLPVGEYSKNVKNLGQDPK